jgi:hypothetical protein
VTARVDPTGSPIPDLPGADAVLVGRLLSAAAVRDGARAIFDLAAAGSTCFSLHLERLDEVADYTIAVTRENYPDLKVPLHSRHGHLRAGGIDRPGRLAAAARGTGVEEPVRSMIDLVVVSVLLDAGAGDRWVYRERRTGRTFSRSEGLAVASFEMFMAGAFCGHHAPRADVAGLCAITPADLERGFHVTPDNPLVGVAGRAALLKALGDCMARMPRVFPRGRISDLLDHLTSGSEVAADHILDFVLRRLGGIWPARLTIHGHDLGDVWPYPPLRSLVAFHKLSQWLTYSLVVPLMEGGYRVTGIEALTGLAEYRNGGLMLDGGLLELRDPALAVGVHEVGSELVVEWRALTVALLDLVAERVRRRLGKTPSELSLAAILEGGTWHAGRKIAREKRPDGAPPLKVASDGTVF